MSLVSIAELVPRVRKILGDEPFEDYLTSSVAAAGTTSVTTNQAATAWVEGDVGEFDDASGDQFKVRVGQTTPLTVKRSHNDTTGAAHSNGVTVLKNPKYAYDEITTAATQMVYGLFPYCWKAATTTITAVDAKYLYDLGVDDFVFLVSVGQKLSSTDSVLYGMTGQGNPVTVERGHNTYTTSQPALRFPNSVKSSAGGFTTIDVTYGAHLTASDLEGTIGLADCVVYGTASKLLSGMDVRRLMGRGGTGDAPPGTATQLADWFWARHVELRQQIHQYLMQTAPPAVTQPRMGDLTDPYAESVFRAMGADQTTPTSGADIPEVVAKQAHGA